MAYLNSKTFILFPAKIPGQNSRPPAKSRSRPIPGPRPNWKVPAPGPAPGQIEVPVDFCMQEMWLCVCWEDSRGILFYNAAVYIPLPLY